MIVMVIGFFIVLRANGNKEFQMPTPRQRHQYTTSSNRKSTQKNNVILYTTKGDTMGGKRTRPLSEWGKIVADECLRVGRERLDMRTNILFWFASNVAYASPKTFYEWLQLDIDDWKYGTVRRLQKFLHSEIMDSYIRQRNEK